MFTYFSPVLKGKYGINKITAILIVLILAMTIVAGYSSYQLLSAPSNSFTTETILANNQGIIVPPESSNTSQNNVQPSSLSIMNFSCTHAGYLIIYAQANNAYQLYANVPIPEISTEFQFDNNRLNSTISPLYFPIYPNNGTVSYFAPVLPGKIQVLVYNWSNQTLFGTISLLLYT